MAKRSPKGSRAAHKDDELSARILEFMGWARQNSTVLVIFGVILAVVVGGVFYYVSFESDLEERAVSELETIQATVASGNADAARAELAQFLERFGGTDVAPEARLTLGRLHLEGDQPEQAARVLEGSSRAIGEPLGTEIHLLLAKAHEAAGQLQEAEEVFLEVADDARLDFQRQDALADAARVRTLQGNAAGAAELYGRILEGMDEGDPERGRFELLQAEARAEARS
jgi:predicted negative regulator of RcsB-dependent stress response